MLKEILHTGLKADIYVYVTKDGEIPVKEFLSTLQEPERKKVFALLKKFADLGELRNEEKFRLEKKPIFVFKSSQVRLCCFIYPGASRKTVVLTHGFLKKSPKMPPKELDRAMSIYQKIMSN